MSLDIAREGKIAKIRLDWPERRNALRPENGREIAEAIEGLRDDVSVIVLCGHSSAFCAGADLKVLRKLIDEGGKDAVYNIVYRNFQRMARSVHESPIPVLSAVDGPASGLGSDLALSCDQCYVGESGWIEHGWGKLGGVPGIGGAWLTTRRGGSRAAWEYFLAQKRFSGIELERMGLATAAPGRAEDTAMDRARYLSTLSSTGVRAYKSLLLGALSETYEEHLGRCVGYQMELATEPGHTRKALDVLFGQASAGTST